MFLSIKERTGNMDITKFREIITKISELDPNAYSEIEKCWRLEVDILSKDIPGTIDYLTNECSEDEYAWISEIIDDLIDTTQSSDLLECYKKLMDKYPDACSTYNIAYTVECAENMLKKL